MQEYYKILGISETASDEEVEKAYKRLKEKYSNERFYEGEVGNEAARNLTKVETAYSEIMSNRHSSSETNETPVDYSEVEALIRDGRIEAAQNKLDNISNRNAEWHYLQSVIFYKKNWFNESKKQLEICLTMEPYNEKYKNSYEKLKKKMSTSESNFRSGNAYNNANNADMNNNRQMGGTDCGSCVECCTTWCCIQMCCNSCYN